MKLRVKATDEEIDAIFEGCEGNLVVVNKNDTSLTGEYSSLRDFLRDFAPPRDGRYARQYRYAKTEKGKAAKHRAYLKRKARNDDFII